MKLEKVVQKLAPAVPLLQCPKCGTGFQLTGTSLCCERGHCFDLSAKGYVNVVPEHRQSADKYDDALFASRALIMQGPYYQPLRQLLKCLLEEATLPENFVLLDVGCGEGTHTEFLAQSFPTASVFGADISRAAIQKAAGGQTKAHWLICDLKHLPFQNGTVDGVLDILTPADYREFARVLKPGGLLMKVFPDDGYLQEIRTALSPYLQNGESYSSDPVEAYLNQHAEIIESHRIKAQFPLTEEASQAFLHMTPMRFSVPEHVLQDIRLSEITIALRVCCCRLPSFGSLYS